VAGNQAAYPTAAASVPFGAVLRSALIKTGKFWLLVAVVVLLGFSRTNADPLFHVLVLAVAFAAIYASFGSGARMWGLYLVGFIFFAQLRSYADETGLPVQFDYPIVLEEALFLGEIPTIWLQDRFYTFAEAAFLEVYTMTVYLSYFFLPHILAFCLWKWDRPRFNHYVLAFVITLWIGLLVSAVLPTAPPWLAAQEGYIDPVYQVVPDVLSGGGEGGTYERGYTVAGANDVAAMPSLHSAIPFVMMFALWKYRGLRWAGVWFAASMPVAVVYLGEHYFVDALAGLGAAGAGWVLARWGLDWWKGRAEERNLEIRGDPATVNDDADSYLPPEPAG
jgi:membrane-associated phospholipid phosphatase